MKHLALAVADQGRSRRFYESYFGFDARPSRWYDGGVLMLYNDDGFSLALGPTEEPIVLPRFCTSAYTCRVGTPFGSFETGSLPTVCPSSKSGTSRTT